ncbi:MAG TPA: hypothetical protein ENN34_11310, partial [Deltaproteobacteria bacterium]|nr:hypothetical protein [Deltaproteobacteria bacterium]
MNTRMTFHIRTLSPVHLGCDEDYEPIGFVIDEGKNTLVSFDPLNFLTSLSSNERDRFAAICRKGTVESLLDVYRFMKGKTFPGREVQLCSGFQDHFRKTLGMK